MLKPVWLPPEQSILPRKGISITMDMQNKKEKVKTLSNMLTVVGILIVLVSLVEYFFTQQLSYMGVGVGLANALAGLILGKQK